MGRNNKLSALVFTVLLVGGIFGLIFGLGGYETLGENEYGLKVNWITRYVEPSAYKGGGFQFIGWENDFIRFPSTWQTVEFSNGPDSDDAPINTQTKDGLAITFDASFQYRLIRDGLYELYSDFQLDYNQQIVQVARGALREEAGEHSATEFLQNRSQVAELMRLKLIEDLGNISVTIDYFQLRAITLPSDFMKATEEVEIANLQKIIAQYNLEAAQIAAQETLLNAEVEANASIIAAQAEYNVSVIEAEAAAAALNITRYQESLAFAMLMNETGMNETEVLQYLYIEALQNLPPGTILVVGDPNQFIISP